MKEIRELLGVSKQEWNNYRTTIRHNVQAARLDFDKDLRNQKSKKFMKLCNASAEVHPQLGRFKNHWGTERLAKEYFRGHKTYTRCVKNLNTYRGHRAPPCSPTHSSDDFDHAAPSSFTHDLMLQNDDASDNDQPVAGPSQPRQSPPPMSDSDSDINTEIDRLQDSEDDEESEDEALVHGKGKSKVIPKRKRAMRNRRRRHM
jgi:hypothetical protein